MSEFLKSSEDISPVAAATTAAAFGSEREGVGAGGEREQRSTLAGTRVTGATSRPSHLGSGSSSGSGATFTNRSFLRSSSSMSSAKVQLLQYLQFLSDSELLESLFLLYACFQCLLIPLLDLQVILPLRYFPSLLARIRENYCSFSLDPFICRPKLWIQGMAFAELFFQLPLLALLLDQYRKEYQVAASLAGRSVVFHLTRLVYSVQAASFMVPILAELGWNPVIGQKWMLLGIYLPFFVMPVIMAITSLTSLTQRFGVFSRQSLMHHQMLSKRRE